MQAGALFDLGRLGRGDRARNEAEIRHLCQAVRLDDAVLCRVLGRYKMFVDWRDVGLAPHLILDGVWEMPLTEAIMGFVRAGMTAVDVGANQGYFTLLLADLVGADGQVHAVEPNPSMLSLLGRSVAVNGFDGRVRMHARPLDARSGNRVSLHVPDGLPQNGSMIGPGHGRLQRFDLTTATLDEIIGDGPVDVVKIDVEGAEEGVWAGMERIIARRQKLAILLEFTPDRYADPVAFLERMMGGGFALGALHPTEGVRPAGIDEVMREPGHHDRMLTLVR